MMFARVITAQTGTEGLDGATGKLIIISRWETREQMDAVTAGAGPSGIRDQHDPATGLTALHLDTYEVALHV
jgi:hypothetical protein